MRLITLLALPLALAACASEDPAPPATLDAPPEVVIEDGDVALDDPLADPSEAAPVETVAPAAVQQPAAAPPPAPPSAPAERAPAVEDHPEGAHTMDDGMVMDGEHTMDDGTPMDHSQMEHSHDGGQ